MSAVSEVTSKSNLIHLSFSSVFTLSKLSELPNNRGDKVLGPAVTMQNRVWQIELYPGGCNEYYPNYFSYFLSCKTLETTIVSYTISLIHNKTMDTECAKDYTFSPTQTKIGFLFGNPISQRAFSADDIITIRTDLRIKQSLDKYIVLEPSLSSMGCASAFNDLLNQDELADVRLIVNKHTDTSSSNSTDAVDKASATTSTGTSVSTKRKYSDVEVADECDSIQLRIPAHKCILAARSPVFRAMFTGGMAETSSNEVLIQDFDAVVMAEFVRFLYTDRCNRSALEQHAEQLLAAACKYQVPGLETLCENYMIDNLTPTKVINLLSIADLYSTEKLRASALHYISRHAKEMVQSEGFFESLSPELLKQVVRALAGVLPDEA